MRVLVIEDEPDLLKALVQALREEGYAADQAQTGPEGLFKAESCEYEAIVLDLMLPGSGGAGRAPPGQNPSEDACSDSDGSRWSE